MILVPPTSLEVDYIRWHYLTTHTMRLARERYFQEYIEWGIRPCVRDSRIVSAENLVIFAVMLDIPEIEVRLDERDDLSATNDFRYPR